MRVKSLFNNKFVSFLLAIILVCVIYQLFFRYEYKVYKVKPPIFAYTVKLDKLTGKSEIVLNEQTKKYLQKKESEEKQIEIKTEQEIKIEKNVGHLDLNDYRKLPKKGTFRYEDYLK